MNDTRFLKLVVIINSLVPLAMLGWDALRNRLGVNPTEFVIHTTGTLTLIFLMLALAITPVMKNTGRSELIKLRRLFGLFAFFYGALHLFSYSWFDKSFRILQIGQDVINRQFIAVGMISFALMIPLAITSTNKMIKRLGGQRWRKLHKKVYYISIGGVLHYWMSVKADTNGPLIFALILCVLLGYRFFAARLRQPSVNAIKITRS
jgi:methionine sulfoxide reductase heme-binding subunit